MRGVKAIGDWQLAIGLEAIIQQSRPNRTIGWSVTNVTAALRIGRYHFAWKRGAAVKDFRDLKVWDKAHRLTLDRYKATADFPREELYGLTIQMRRCSASIAANLAEGCGKRGNNEFQR